jgi:hypothetical protein
MDDDEEFWTEVGLLLIPTDAAEQRGRLDQFLARFGSEFPDRAHGSLEDFKRYAVHVLFINVAIRLQEGPDPARD